MTIIYHAKSFSWYFLFYIQSFYHMSFFHLKSFWSPSFIMQNHFHDNHFLYTIILPYVLFSCKIIQVTIIYYAKPFPWQSFSIYNHFTTCPFPCKIILVTIISHAQWFQWQSFSTHNHFIMCPFQGKSFRHNQFYA